MRWQTPAHRVGRWSKYHQHRALKILAVRRDHRVLRRRCKVRPLLVRTTTGAHQRASGQWCIRNACTTQDIKNKSFHSSPSRNESSQHGAAGTHCAAPACSDDVFGRYWMQKLTSATSCSTLLFKFFRRQASNQSMVAGRPTSQEHAIRLPMQTAISRSCTTKLHAKIRSPCIAFIRRPLSILNQSSTSRSSTCKCKFPLPVSSNARQSQSSGNS
mmetsp:Transcript_53422/g.135583  ORF Transcript_53422/g.135583 Transcript_53422/m.135583 type:complete len:215 (-) Transcript_53422:195-839(-)